ncbi:MAG: alpha/beta fold hydrolase [Candidatus Heimdallarchaeota archaeon]|nr:MAG: alpha/beta fold hydrolase [Candidatus Heimdallarchaeota archaeon]
MRIVYLYGFASGPQSDKAQFFKKKFTKLNVSFDIYDYIPNRENFTYLKTSTLLEKLNAHIKKKYSGEKVILFGSSFGGLISTWYTHLYVENVSKLILMAPALRFSASRICKLLEIIPSQWKKRGVVPIFHYRYDREIPLAYSFYEDILANPPPEFKDNTFSIPTLIFHGKFDETVPVEWSQELQFVQNVIFHTLNSDHQLLDQKNTMWNIIREFLQI